MIGKVLAQYQITEKLGEGGMGVVWKARDTHLDRFVALKTLSAERLTDPERKRRFVQEAKAASALNHPNIVTVYDIAEADGVQFIAMEYVAGKTLDQLIGRKGLRLNETLKYAVQIADALAKAHSAGIIHRDLKPSNVMVTENGLVKVLDFGLAKLAETATGEFGDTATARAPESPSTEEGTIVGTTSYMSPEQAECQPLDARTDIFSFGVVLYEMLSGSKPFQGTSRIATMSAILKESPKPLSGLVQGIPPELERVVERCLRKDPERRWQSMRDLRVALLELKEESDSGALTPLQPQKRAATKRWGLVAAAAAAVVLLIGGVALWRTNRPAVKPDQEVTVVPLTAHPGDERDPTFSPDGNQVAFAWGPEGGAPAIYVKLVGPGEPIRLTHTTDDERMPQWSPDGKWVAFPRSGPKRSQVVVIPALGGPEKILAQDRGSAYTSWSADGQWVAYCKENDSLYLSPLNGGETKFVLGPLQGKFPVFAGILSPDSRKVAVVYGIGQNMPLYVVSLSADYKPEGEPKPLTPADWDVVSPVWTADGKEILFIRSTGEANAGSDTAMYRVAVESGTAKRVNFAGDNPWFLGVARRGNRMAFTRLHRDINIYRVELEADGALRKAGEAIASSSRRDDAAQYSPDGSRVAFASNRTGSMEIWTAQADGQNPVQLTTSPDAKSTGGPQWSPDGNKIAYVSRSKTGPTTTIFVIAASGGAPQALTTGPATDTWPTWSRDGRWVYFASDRDGSGSMWNVWKVGSSGGPVTQVTRGGDDFALESPDRKWLYLSASEDTIRRMPVEGGEEVEYAHDYAGNNSFFVTAKGVYYLSRAAGRGGAIVRFIGHEGGEPKTLGSIPRAPSVGLGLSPDSRWLLYSQYDQSAAEVMLVENFH
jgi:serine/threonine protein kinase